MNKKSYNLTHNPYGKLKEFTGTQMQCFIASEPVSENVFNTFRRLQKDNEILKDNYRRDTIRLAKDNKLLKANNQDRKKIIDEILTAIQDKEVITGGMLEDWGQTEYGIEHRTEAKG